MLCLHDSNILFIAPLPVLNLHPNRPDKRFMERGYQVYSKFIRLDDAAAFEDAAVPFHLTRLPRIASPCRTALENLQHGTTQLRQQAAIN